MTTIQLLQNFKECGAETFSFFASGSPKTQGSKNAFARIVRDRHGKQRAVAAMVEQSKGLDEWRSAVGRFAIRSRPPGWELHGLFLLEVCFYMPRPKAHFNTKGELKPGAPILHDKLGDVDKLLRACGDALTGICYRDDALIVGAAPVKLFCRPELGPGAAIAITRLSEKTAHGAAIALSP